MFRARIARSRYPVTDGPANHPPRMQVQNHGQIQPTFARPDITDINNPFLVGPIRCKVAVQQVRRDVELVIAVRSYLVFARSDHRYTVLAHQPANTPMTDFQPQFFEFLRHPGPPIAAQRQAMLFSDMSQQHHILTLALADRT